MGRLGHWLEAECRERGVAIEVGSEATVDILDAAADNGAIVVLATGSRPAPLSFATDGSCPVVDAADLLGTGPAALPGGPVLVHDPVGGPVGVGLAEWLAASGRAVELVTPDPVAGTLLSRTGDLADANVRLERAGVRRQLKARLREVKDGVATIEDVWTGQRQQVTSATVVDCGHRLPDDALAKLRPALARAGDCTAPRTVLEAVLEGRRRALEATSAGAGGIRAGALEAVG